MTSLHSSDGHGSLAILDRIVEVDKTGLVGDRADVRTDPLQVGQAGIRGIPPNRATDGEREDAAARFAVLAHWPELLNDDDHTIVGRRTTSGPAWAAARGALPGP